MTKGIEINLSNNSNNTFVDNFISNTRMRAMHIIIIISIDIVIVVVILFKSKLIQIGGVCYIGLTMVTYQKQCDS